jgi:hypothetical protein
MRRSAIVPGMVLMVRHRHAGLGHVVHGAVCHAHARHELRGEQRGHHAGASRGQEERSGPGVHEGLQVIAAARHGNPVSLTLSGPAGMYRTMLRRVLRRAGPLIAVLCLLLTMAGNPVMVFRQMTEGHPPGAVQRGHHPGHSERDCPRGDHRNDSCCDLCVAGCETPPEPPPPAALPAAVVTTIPLQRPSSSGQLTSALRVHYRLPFAQGPPPPLS